MTPEPNPEFLTQSQSFSDKHPGIATLGLAAILLAPAAAVFGLLWLFTRKRKGR